MTRLFPHRENSKNLLGSIWRVLIICACVAIGVWMEVPRAVAQVHSAVPIHAGGGHAGGGARASAPVRPAIPPASRGYAGPRGAGLRGIGPYFSHFDGVGTGVRFAFGPRPMHIFRRRIFFRPFFWYGVGWGWNSFWWSPCGVTSGSAWNWGFGCPAGIYETGNGTGAAPGFENYVTMPAYEAPEYVYGAEGSEQVWLYMKDGPVYRVNDYWFVNGQVHFTVTEQDPVRPVEHVVPSEQLDVQKTTSVNAARGFRMVMRDEPWQQYLKDHPEANPPELVPPEKN
jgi:hypothetical protein